MHKGCAMVMATNADVLLAVDGVRAALVDRPDASPLEFRGDSAWLPLLEGVLLRFGIDDEGGEISFAFGARHAVRARRAPCGTVIVLVRGLPSLALDIPLVAETRVLPLTPPRAPQVSLPPTLPQSDEE